MASTAILSVKIISDAKNAAAGLDSTSSKMGKLGKVAGVAGAAMAAGAAIGAKALWDATQSAADLEQSIGAVDTVFGKSADKMHTWAKGAATDVGLTRNEFNELGTLIGSQLKNGGTAMDELAPKTRNLIKTGADLSSMFGGTTREAVEALSSALKGERDPIEKYGVSLNQAKIDAEAASLGFKKVDGALSSQAQQAATLSLIMKQTSDAHGNFAKESDTLAHQQQVLGAQMGNLRDKIGTALLPMLTDLAKYANDNLVPALEDAADWFTRNSDDIKALGSDIANSVIPPAKDLVGVVGDLVGWFRDLPAPVREFGVQAGAAALILPKLNTALVATKTASTGLVGSLRNAETRTRALGTAARNVAGIGGMVALTQGAQQSNDALAILGKVGGGAMMGFAVGGPIGAAVGGGAGALWALHDAAKAAGEQVQITARTGVMDLAASLDQVTGAATRATRAQILHAAQAEGVVGLATRMGINTRDLIGAVMGQEGATRRLTRAQRDNFTLLKGNEQADFNNWLRQNTNAYQRQSAAVRKNNRDTMTWKESLKGLPKEVRTRVKQIGADISTKQLRALKKRYDLNPKQVQTIIEAIGTERTIKRVKGVWTVLENGKKIKADLGPFTETFLSGMDKVKGNADKDVAKVADNLKRGTAKAKPDLGPFGTVFRQQADNIKSDASSKGEGIGSNLGSGINSGIASWTETIAATAANAVARAVAAARREARIKSPSRKMMEVGEQMMAGLNKGIEDNTRQVERSLARAVRFEAPELPPITRRISPSSSTRAATDAPVRVEVNVNGLVTDPVNTGRQIKKALEEYGILTGAPA